jgi:hypothetical protein
MWLDLSPPNVKSSSLIIHLTFEHLMLVNCFTIFAAVIVVLVEAVVAN